MIRILAACAIGAALAGAATFTMTTIAVSTTTSSEPVNETLYNYGDR